ncbi:MAG: hypothetical protein ACRD3W_05795, partial [Terriglobales bacterium]
MPVAVSLLACLVWLAVPGFAQNIRPLPALRIAQNSSTAPVPGRQVPSNTTGLSPHSAEENPPSTTTGLTPTNGSAPPITAEDAQTSQELEAIAGQATKSSGAVFKGPDSVVVKAPLLTALITLDQKRSPYDLDADSQAAITLREVLQTALASNLDIKISQADSDIRKWKHFEALTGFLPSLGNEIVYEGLHGNY